MPLFIGTAAKPGSVRFCTLERLADGWRWNAVALAWQAAPGEVNQRVMMTEGGGFEAGTFTVAVTGLGDAGFIRMRVHDDADSLDRSVGGGQVYVRGGEEVAPPLAAGAITESTITTPPETVGRPAGILGMVRRIYE